jgi:predicted dehydrogenase
LFDSENVDIVTIATPPFARAEYVKMACAAGKHLMVEKPMARTLEDALSIFSAVRESGVKCFVPFARAVSSMMRKIVDAFESDRFGRPVAFIHTNLSTPYGWVPLDHWMHNMEESGGPIFDYSIHFIELARSCMMSEARRVSYAGSAVTNRVKSDDHAVLAIEYENEAMGEFTKSWTFPPQVRLGHQTTHIVCQDAVIVLDASGTTVYTNDGASKLESPKNQVPGRAEAYLNLISAIEDGTPLYASELEGLRTNEILHSALASRESGRKEPVELHN